MLLLRFLRLLLCSIINYYNYYGSAGGGDSDSDDSDSGVITIALQKNKKKQIRHYKIVSSGERKMDGRDSDSNENKSRQNIAFLLFNYYVYTVKKSLALLFYSICFYNFQIIFSGLAILFSIFSKVILTTVFLLYHE